jgi:hypothetical protein
VADQPEKAERSRIVAPMAELQPGMTLCEDVLARGVVMLSKGVTLDPRLLLVLQDMRSVIEKSEFLVELPSES